MSNELRVSGAREYETKDPFLLPNEAASLGPDHFPTPHRESALSMIRAIQDAGIDILDQTHVVDGVRSVGENTRSWRESTGNYGDIVISQAHLFSLYRVSWQGRSDLIIGYRNSIAQTMARRACVGKHFPICTNISLFGNDIVFAKKNTRLQQDLYQIALEGIQHRVLPAFRTIDEQLDVMRQTTLVPVERRSLTLAAFEQGVLPTRMVHTMRDLWDNLEQDNAPEVYENRDNKLGLMHSMTRVTRDLPTRLKAAASQRIGRFFNFGNFSARA